ncbi:MAG: D-alanine--D-alanine ligase [Puniceicoccales bacterium]|jgi:D-alanine-D-alanine ligase|nr:D-alanine--D-alanine ligase [Puniceicoccales bacterium]
MKKNVIVLAGGERSSEREISLRSGRLVYASLLKNFRAELIIYDRDELPDGMAGRRDAIIFPMTPGEFGEDGGLQALMDDAGLCYVGSGKEASALCMNKCAAKKVVADSGVPIVGGVRFFVRGGKAVGLDASHLSGDYVLKPNDRGSSIGVKKINAENIGEAIAEAHDGEFLLETNITGKDLTVGVLDGRALGIVEILPKHGFLDYNSKYAVGASDRICPAPIGPEATEKIKTYSEIAYRRCGCRDWARVDFMIDDFGNVFFLEINTLPGMAQLSFYPLSAAAAGISYDDLLVKLVNLAALRSGMPHE